MSRATVGTSGVSLNELRAPIGRALDAFSKESYFFTGDWGVDFDLRKAVDLTPTDGDKAYTTRSDSDVTFLGRTAGKLVVIAFAPGEGTGDESLHTLDTIEGDHYPRKRAVLPRSKAAVDTEVLLPLVSFDLGAESGRPNVLGGNFDLLVFDHLARTVVKAAELGHTRQDLFDADPGDTLTVAASLTTGRLGEIDQDNTSLYGHRNGERFGDPHAIYNPHPQLVQVAGFIATTPENATEFNAVFRHLGASEPQWQPGFPAGPSGHADVR